mgnify:CR=1 FL=1
MGDLDYQAVVLAGEPVPTAPSTVPNRFHMRGPMTSIANS